MKKKPAPSAPAKKAKSLATPDRAAGKLFDRVANILDEARSSVVRAVNSRMILAYWLIGREIVLELQKGEKRANFGAALISNLSQRLTLRYGQGFSISGLKDFRLFFLIYADRES